VCGDPTPLVAASELATTGDDQLTSLATQLGRLANPLARLAIQLARLAIELARIATNSLGSRPNSLGSRPNSLDSRSNSLDLRSNSLDSRPNSLESRFNSLESRPERLESNPKQAASRSLLREIPIKPTICCSDMEYQVALSLLLGDLSGSSRFTAAEPPETQTQKAARADEMLGSCLGPNPPIENPTSSSRMRRSQ
jgi:hypothetical protein